MSSRRPRLKIRNNDIPSKIIKFYWHVLLCFTQMKTGGGGVYDKPSQNSNYVTGVVYIYILHAVFWGGVCSCSVHVLFKSSQDCLNNEQKADNQWLCLLFAYFKGNHREYA